MTNEFRKLEQSIDLAFKRAEQLNEVFERSEKPRQRRIIEILHRHGLPAFIGPFFDAYFRITVQGGDIETLSALMVTKLSKYLGEDTEKVARKHRAVVADYVEFMSEDFDEGGRSSASEQFMPLEG